MAVLLPLPLGDKPLRRVAASGGCALSVQRECGGPSGFDLLRLSIRFCPNLRPQLLSQRLA